MTKPLFAIGALAIMLVAVSPVSVPVSGQEPQKPVRAGRSYVPPGGMSFTYPMPMQAALGGSLLSQTGGPDVAAAR